MAKRYNLRQILKMREIYFIDTYKKYIYNIFTEYNRPKREQIILGMEEHNQRPEILENYLQNNDFPVAQKELMASWKNEIYGNMHIICFDKNKVFVYCEETNDIYHVLLVDKTLKDNLKNIPFYMSIHTDMFPIYGEYYFDSIVNIQSECDSSLVACEKLYEHIYNLILQKPDLLSRCFIYSQRSLETDKFSKIFLDYMGPMCPLAMTSYELETSIQLAMMVWNKDIVDEIDISPIQDDDVVRFLTERRKKCFSHINRVIVDYQVEYDNDGFEILVASRSLKDK